MKFTLRELRARYGKTQKDVAKDFGIDTSTYSKWEKDISRVPVRTAIALAEYFKVTINDLKF